jgi:hypothetical protein
MDATLKGGKIATLEITCPETQPDGTEKLVKVLIKQVFDAEGNPVGPCTEERIDG